MKTFTLAVFLLTCYTISNAQTTVIPDANFEIFLEANGMGDGIPNNQLVTTANINTVQNLNVSNQNIANLTGIEDFVALTILDCRINSLTSLNLSQNTNLTELFTTNNSLTNLDLSQNLGLTSLYCYDNQLTSLDLSQNTGLTRLYSSNNQLISLDLSQNLVLTQMSCANNQLTSLDVKNGNNTSIFYFDATNNPNLTCINVDDDVWSMSNWTSIDPQTLFSTNNCNPVVYTLIPDVNFENALSLYDDIPNDGQVPTANINTLINLSVVGQNISDLTGIEDFTALKTFSCGNNNLTSLNVSQNIALESLDFRNNQLTSIDVTQNTALKILGCQNNQLTSLDVSQNIALEDLNFYQNQLTSIDVSQNINLIYLTCGFNQLTNIDVSQITGLLVLNCRNNLLTSIDVSQNTGLTELNCRNNLFTSLDVTQNTVLEYLTCGFNQLTSLDVTQNINLIYLICGFNQLTSLDVTQNTVLEYLQCGNNSLTSIDVTQNTVLENISCTSNQLTNLDVSQNINLLYLTCYTNQLTSLDLTQNTLLESLICSDNLLTSIDVTQNTVLESLNCSSSLLTSLDVSQNINLRNLAFRFNQLTGINIIQNTTLETLDSRDNQLTSLDVSQNIVLKELRCNNNQLTSLDVSQNTTLELLDSRNNLLTSLDVRNGNNINIGNAFFRTTNNPNLTCIEVDDATWSTTNWTSNIDPQHYFSINCSGTSIQLSAKAYLQGAATNPNVGEETWMRDDLRVASLIPTTSPYADALTCNASVFTPTGANAIVDWVWVELRDENDNTNILTSTSALLQRDGDIVATDGISPLSFNLTDGNYYVAISHRNHLGIISANTFSLSSTVSVVDLSNSFAVINGEINAVIDLGNGIFACYAGDFDGNDQIQNTDVSQVVNQLGNSGYSNADTNLNGQTQNTDINILINPNIGKGQQYLREQLNLYAKRRNN